MLPYLRKIPNNYNYIGDAFPELDDGHVKIVLTVNLHSSNSEMYSCHFS